MKAQLQGPPPSDAKAVAGVLELGVKAATAYGRPDLAARLSVLLDRLGRDDVHVYVVGDYKTGKSTLVNALVGAEVCPVDDGIATTVPTMIRHAPQPTAQAVFEPEAADGEPVTRDVEFADVADLVSEAGNPANRRRIRLVEVGVPQPVLASGLVLVDTPGVGGLASPESAATLAAATGADAVMFATSAAQELTQPEVDLLEAVTASCPRAITVLTKTDIYPAWRRIAELDRKHLAHRDIAVDVVPVSSEIRQQALAAGDAALNEESGFLELATRLREDVIDAVRGGVAGEAAQAVVSVAQQIAAGFEAEREVLADPDHLAAVSARLAETRERAERLRSAGSKWQQTLMDGVQDLTSDVDHDIRGRIRRLVVEADEAIDVSDPSRTFDELGSWLERRLTADVLGNYALLTNRSRELAATVAEHFAEEEREVGIELDGSSAMAVVAELDLGAAPERQGNPATQGLLALRNAYLTMLMLGTLGTLAGLAALTPVIGVVAAAIGGKALKDERTRQLTIRRQQAKQGVRKYLDEAQFRVAKDTHDALRRVHRTLRDTFMARAQEALRSANEALQAAQQAAGTAEAERVNRLRDIDAELKRLAELRARALALTPAR